ncbi:hypothetical protein D4A39_04330 [Alcanivorax profundi]|mgnify:FL=1|uniref:Uncharacterized protein n=1 Tax=Alcanivorax profundi TaxID=2338368 RepID=A0A418Y3K3_9GAMM|nr:hypothetical protein [Alcanivorax profundi]RJG20063.1 hypothetical protein D4A39_04330 [Alcanivorax profundi]
MAKRLLGSLLAVALLPIQGMAAITNTDLEEFELSLWQVRTDFHMLTVMTGSDSYASDLDRSISRAQAALASLNGDAEGSEERDLVAALEKDWKIYEDAASGNTMAEQGFTNAYTIQDVNELPAIMVERMDAFGDAKSGQYDDVLALAAYLQRMTSEYLNLAADPSGGMAAGSDEGRLEFKDAVPQFEKMLAAAQRKHSGDEAMARALNQVGLKWQFIRESMVKFYENAVPFLIYRYTRQMVETMDQAISLASTEVEKPTFGPVD